MPHPSVSCSCHESGDRIPFRASQQNRDQISQALPPPFVIVPVRGTILGWGKGPETRLTLFQKVSGDLLAWPMQHQNLSWGRKKGRREGGRDGGREEGSRWVQKEGKWFTEEFFLLFFELHVHADVGLMRLVYTDPERIVRLAYTLNVSSG